MNLQPIGDKVLIRPDAKATKHGRLFLPENGEYRPRYGTVLAVGPGIIRAEMAKCLTCNGKGIMPNPPGVCSFAAMRCHACNGDGAIWSHLRQPMSVKAGDRVAFSQYGTDGIETVDGEEVLIIKEERILAVEKPEAVAIGLDFGLGDDKTGISMTKADIDAFNHSAAFVKRHGLGREDKEALERRLTVQDERTLERQHDAEVERRRAYIEGR